MVQGSASALIIAKPGWLRDSLQALVTAVPQIGSVVLVDDGPSALKMVTAHHPSLVLLDTNMPGDGIQVLRQIKAKWPQARYLVLANDGQQQQAARVVGADDVLLKGYPAARLFVTIEELLKGR